MSIEWVIPFNHFILCCSILLLPSILPSIRVFSNESALHIRWPKDWSFSFSISPSNEYSGFIAFWIDWLDLLTVQEILKSLLQHHNAKATIFQCSAFFMVQFPHPYMTTGKTIALTIQILVSQMMSLLFNKLSKFVIAFFTRRNCLLILWLLPTSTVIFEAQKSHIYHCFHCFSIYFPWSYGTRCHDLSFFECWILSQLFHSPLSSSSRGSLVPLCFLALELYICISEVFDISPDNLDPRLGFISPAFCMVYSISKLNKQGDSIQPQHTLFPILNQSFVPCSNCSFLTWKQVSQETAKVVWYSHLLKNFLQFIVCDPDS